MSYSADKLYNLLPAVYRQRDGEVGNALYSLISIIAEQIKILEDDTDGLYDNWFIETCDEWLVPYIADLMRVRGIHSVNNGSYSQRAYVANTIRYRRAKGTLSIIEQLSRDITGWQNTQAVEFFQLLSTTQYLNHLRLDNKIVDLRDTNKLDLLETPFDTVTHTVDVRHISKRKGIDANDYSIPGYYNIPNIGLFLWRLEVYPAKDVPAFKHDSNRFSFHPFGHDAPLFNFPATESGTAPLSKEINIACPIRRYAMYKQLSNYYYDPSVSSQNPIKITIGGTAVDISDIEVCNLTNWENNAHASGKVAIDPVLGRILFSDSQDGKTVNVSYNYGFSGKTGGGFYTRPISKYDLSENNVQIFKVSKDVSTSQSTTIQNAINSWDGTTSAIFEIQDNETYYEDITINLLPGIAVEIRSLQNRRPVIAGSLTVTGQSTPALTIGPSGTQITAAGSGSSLVLESLFFDTIDTGSNLSESKNIITVGSGNLQTLAISHCTILPKTYLFSWHNVHGSAITGYNIYRSVVSGGEGTTPIATVSGSTLSYTDTGLTNGVTYFYKVTAVNSVGESAQSNEASATPTASATAPQPPTGLTATAGNSQVSLSWSAPSSNGGSEKYRLIDFLKQVFYPATWFDSASITKSPNGSTITITSSDNANTATITLDNVDETKAKIATLVISTKSYDLTVIEENGVTNIYVDRTSLQVNGYNNDLNIILDKTICGRIRTIQSFFISNWASITNNTNDTNLVTFLKQNSSNFNWLNGTENVTNSGDTITITSADEKHSVTLSKATDNMYLEIDGKETSEFEIKTQDNKTYQLYAKSEARLAISDSIVDGKGNDFAINSYSATINNSTIFGQVNLALMKQASNSIFTDKVLVEQRQQGCVRYSYVPCYSQVPPCYQCQPNNQSSGSSQNVKIYPRFTSEKYGDPGYAQLDKNIVKEIFEGADNKQEMGAFNYLYQAQRIKDLLFSFDEYMRAGMEAGVFLET